MRAQHYTSPAVVYRLGLGPLQFVMRRARILARGKIIKFGGKLAVRLITFGLLIAIVSV